MPRILFFLVLLSLSPKGIAQEWLYAKVWPDKSSHSLARMKLVAADGRDPFYIVSRHREFPEQNSWNWMSEEGGVLRLFTSDSTARDSALLVSGQTTWKALRKQNTWFLPNENQPLILRKKIQEDIWLLEVQLAPIEGVQSTPEPILVLRIAPHPKKKNRFLIETTGNLQSIPVVLLELGISLALITTYSEPSACD